MINRAGLQIESEISLRGNGKEIGILHTESASFRTSDPAEENILRAAIPCSAINDGLTIRGKSGPADESIPKRELLKSGWYRGSLCLKHGCLLYPDELSAEEAAYDGKNRESEGKIMPERASRLLQNRGGSSARRRRQRFKRKSKIACRLKAAVRILFQTTPDDPFQRGRNAGTGLGQ